MRQYHDLLEHSRRRCGEAQPHQHQHAEITRRGQSLAKSSVVRQSKIGLPMSQMGQTRSFGDVGSMSGLPESGQNPTHEFWGPGGGIFSAMPRRCRPRRPIFVSAARPR
jgi:hypothetical protein